jgi:fatty acid desaturase
MSITNFTHEEQQAIEDKGFVGRMVCLPAAVTGLLALAFHWPFEHWAVHLFFTLYTAFFLFCWTSCFHETAHQTLTRWRWLDIAIGRILGTFIYVPYTVYRESHIRHHAYVNRPTDWELWPYSDPKCSLTFRRVFVFFDIFFGFIVAPYIYSRIYFHKNSPLKNPAVRRTIAWEYAGIILFWGLAFTRIYYRNRWSIYAEVWLVPHMIAGMLQTMRKLTEHLGMSSYDPMIGTRTVISENLITRLASFVNFDIFVHGPHHRHPRLAQNLLKGKMADYMTENPATTYPVYRSYLSATLAMTPYLFRNPGIGVNVGAAPPDEGKTDDATNFAADVSSEVA